MGCLFCPRKRRRASRRPRIPSPPAAPFIKYYYSSQFAPLVVFFLLYLAVVRNTKLHHFVRFHAMQATMLDIISMIFTLVRGYLPPAVMWSPLVGFYDTFSYTVCLFPVLYCIVYALE